MDDSMKNKESVANKKSIGQELVELLVRIILLLFICYFIVIFIGQRTVVSGSSMTPTLEHNDNLIVDKISYRFQDPERFDVVVFDYQDGRYFIKRVIGLPGETIQIINGSVYINNVLLEEDIYGNEKMVYAGRASQPITLGENEYFVLGDNRNGSKDSRVEEVGNVKRSQIQGKALLRIWPLNKVGFVKNIKMHPIKGEES